MKLGNQFVCTSKGLSLSIYLSCPYLSLLLPPWGIETWLLTSAGEHQHQPFPLRVSLFRFCLFCFFYHVRHGKTKVLYAFSGTRRFTKPNWQSLNATPLQKLEHHRSLVDRLLLTYFLNQELVLRPHLHNSGCPPCSPTTSAVSPEPELFHNTQTHTRARS